MPPVHATLFCKHALRTQTVLLRLWLLIHSLLGHTWARCICMLLRSRRLRLPLLRGWCRRRLLGGSLPRLLLLLPPSILLVPRRCGRDAFGQCGGRPRKRGRVRMVLGLLGLLVLLGVGVGGGHCAPA